jgi:hypothetical protein
MLAFRGAGGEPPQRKRLRGLTQCHKDKITKNNILQINDENLLVWEFIMAQFY